MFPALLTALFFATTAVCATQAAALLGPSRANMARMVIALLILGAWSHVFAQGMGGGQVTRFLLAGAIGFGLGGWCMFQALDRIGSTMALLMVECAAAISAGLLAWWLLGASLSYSQILFAAAVILGIAVALAPRSRPAMPTSLLLAGIAFTIMAAVAQGLSWTLSKAAFSALQSEGIPFSPLNAAYQRMAGGLLIALPLAFLCFRREAAQRPPLLSRHDRRRAAQWVFANAMAGPVLGVTCMLWAIREVANPGLVQAVAATATFFSVPMARRLENRIFTPRYFLGAALSLLGVAGLLLTPATHASPVYSLEPYRVVENTDPHESHPFAHFDTATRPLTSVAQRLTELPELSFQQRGPETIEPNVRGLTGDRVTTWFNGVYLPIAAPTRTASPINAFHGDSFHSLALHPAVADPLLAPPVTGGLLRLSLKSPLLDDQPSPAPQIAAAYHTDRVGYRLNASATTQWIPESADLHLAFHQSSLGDFSAADGRRVDADSKSKSVSAISGFRFNSATSASVAVHYSQQDRIRNPSLPLDTLDGDGWVIAANAEHSLGPATLQATLGHAAFHPFLSSRERPRRAAAPIRSIEAAPSASATTARLTASWPLQQGQIELSLDALDQARDAVRTRVLKEGPTFYDRLWPDIRSRQMGIAAAYQQKLSPSTDFRLALRIDRLRQEAKATHHPVLAMPGAVKGSIMDNFLHFNGPAADQSRSYLTVGSARFQFNWTVSSALTASLQIGYASSPPGPTQRYRAFVSALGGGAELGNPALDPESIRHLALSFQFHQPDFAVRFQSFYSGIKDFIQRQAINQSPLVYSYRNSEARLYGFSLSGFLRGLASENTELRFPFQASVSRSLHPKTHQRLAESPPWNASAGLQLTQSRHRFSFHTTVTARYVGAASNEEPDRVPLYTDTGGAFFLNASVSLAGHQNRSWEIRLRATNLLDRKAFAYLQPPVTTGPILPSSGDLRPGDRIPLQGRAFILESRWRF